MELRGRGQHTKKKERKNKNTQREKPTAKETMKANAKTTKGSFTLRCAWPPFFRPGQKEGVGLWTGCGQSTQ